MTLRLLALLPMSVGVVAVAFLRTAPQVGGQEHLE